MAVTKLSVSDVRNRVNDAGEIKKGQTILDQGKLRHLARTDNKLYADAAGSGGSTYQVSITFDDAGKVLGRRGRQGNCSCRAAWGRDFCKHSVALLLAWSKTPEAFVVTELPAEDEPKPGGDAAPGSAPRKRSKKPGGAAPKVDGNELKKQGAERVDTMVRELMVTGTGAISKERIAQLEELAASLFQLQLRRLEERTLGLARMLAAKDAASDAMRIATTLCDMLLTAARIKAHCEGKTLEDRYVTELIGKTWRKNERTPAADLELLEYAYSKVTNNKEMRICSSRFLDLRSGEHWVEMEILPKHLVKGGGGREKEAKPSYAGTVLQGAHGGQFPGFAPWRLYYEGEERRRPVEDADLQRMLEHAKSVGETMERFQEHRRDVFAPDRVPVLVRAKGVVAQAGRLRIFDETGATLHLRQSAGLETRLSDALEGKELLAVVGELDLDHAIPTLWPFTLVVRDASGFALRPAGAPRKSDKPPKPRPWTEVARDAGLSYAAVSVGELREELADRLVAGLAGLDPRAAEPLVTRLRELKLAKPAELLAQLVAQPDPAARVGDFVKLFQVLGVATVKLAGAATVELDGLVPVPTHRSIYIRAPESQLAPGEVMAARLRGEITPYEAAVHYHRHYSTLRAEQMTDDLMVLADGGAMPYVIDAIAQRPEQALSVAESIFALPMGTAALHTAFGLLERVATPEAELLLKEFAGRRRRIRRYRDQVAHLADDALLAVQLRSKHVLSPLAESRRDHLAQEVGPLISQARADMDAHSRELGCDALANLGAHQAIPELRTVFRSDRAKGVREHAAMALAALGDVRMTEEFVHALRDEGNESMARTACRALGRLGDSRALPVMMAIYREGFTPSVVAEAWLGFGVLALDPILEMIDADPALSKRSALAAPLAHMPREWLVDRLVTRLRAGKEVIDLDDEVIAARVPAYLRLCADAPEARTAVARAVLDAHTGGKAGPGKKALTAARKLVPPA